MHTISRSTYESYEGAKKTSKLFYFTEFSDQSAQITHMYIRGEKIYTVTPDHSALIDAAKTFTRSDKEWNNNDIQLQEMLNAIFSNSMPDCQPIIKGTLNLLQKAHPFFENIDFCKQYLEDAILKKLDNKYEQLIQYIYESLLEEHEISIPADYTNLNSKAQREITSAVYVVLINRLWQSFTYLLDNCKPLWSNANQYTVFNTFMGKIEPHQLLFSAPPQYKLSKEQLANCSYKVMHYYTHQLICDYISESKSSNNADPESINVSNSPINPEPASIHNTFLRHSGIQTSPVVLSRIINTLEMATQFVLNFDSVYNKYLTQMSRSQAFYLFFFFVCQHNVDDEKEIFGYNKIELSINNFFDIIPTKNEEFTEMYPKEMWKLKDKVEKMSTLFPSDTIQSEQKSNNNNKSLKYLPKNIEKNYEYLAKFIPPQSDNYFMSNIFECTCFEQLIILEIVGCFRRKSYPVMCANVNCMKIFFPPNRRFKYCPCCSSQPSYDKTSREKQSWFIKAKQSEYHYYHVNCKQSPTDAWHNDAKELCRKYEADCNSDKDWNDPAEDIQQNFYQEIDIISAKHKLPPHKRYKTRKKGNNCTE